MQILRKGVKKQLSATISERPRFLHDVSSMVHLGEGDFEFDFDIEGLDQHLQQLDDLELHEHLRKTLEDPKFKKMLESLQNNDELERKLEQKRKKVEEKLQKLEEKLQSKSLQHMSKTST